MWELTGITYICFYIYLTFFYIKEKKNFLKRSENHCTQIFIKKKSVKDPHLNDVPDVHIQNEGSKKIRYLYYFFEDKEIFLRIKLYGFKER